MEGGKYAGSSGLTKHKTHLLKENPLKVREET